MFAAGLLPFTLLVATLGRPTLALQNLITRSQHDAAPSGFVEGGAPSDSTIQLTIAMPQNHISGLHAALLDVSDPYSPNYGKHLSKDEVARFVAPKPESVQAVTNWLSKNGITATNGTLAGDEMNIQIPLEKANSLLAANFTTFVHVETNTSMVRTLAYSLPANLADHISFVYPTAHFMPPASKSGSMRITRMAPPHSLENVVARNDVPADCSNTITPACLFALYNIPPGPASAPGNNLFVAGFNQDIAADDDLQTFLTQTRPDNPSLASTTYQLLSVNGVENFTEGTDEGNADIQYTRGVATNVPVTYVSFGGGGMLSDNLAMINFLIQQDPAPLVLTTSYGFQETTAQSNLDLAIQLCNAYAQLGARGTSVLFSSGDSGVAGSAFRDPVCFSDNRFLPTYPSGCPYVTSVGGTTGINPEVALSISSGGFSNVFARPTYQDTAVGQYLTALGNNNTGLYNTSGRAYPDVALQAQFYFVLTNGVPLDGGFEGTSASSPVFASMVSLVNDRLLNAGKPPLGFLNPLLYSDKATSMFNDITEGSNPGCNTDGFSAIQGWDAVTGFGSVDFERFLAVALADDPATNSTQPSASQGSTGATQTQGSGISTQAATASTQSAATTSASSQSASPTGAKDNGSMRRDAAALGVGFAPISLIALLLSLATAVV